MNEFINKYTGIIKVKWEIVELKKTVRKLMEGLCVIDIYILLGLPINKL